MEEVPICAGLQIIDADLLTQSIPRHRSLSADIDNRSMVEEVFEKLKK
jgi:hypothetical protein